MCNYLAYTTYASILNHSFAKLFVSLTHRKFKAVCIWEECSAWGLTGWCLSGGNDNNRNGLFTDVDAVLRRVEWSLIAICIRFYFFAPVVVATLFRTDGRLGSAVRIAFAVLAVAVATEEALTFLIKSSSGFPAAVVCRKKQLVFQELEIKCNHVMANIDVTWVYFFFSIVGSEYGSSQLLIL